MKSVLVVVLESVLKGLAVVVLESVLMLESVLVLRLESVLRELVVLMVVLSTVLMLELVLASFPLPVSVGAVPCLLGSYLSLQESVLSLLLAAIGCTPPSSMYQLLFRGCC